MPSVGRDRAALVAAAAALLWLAGVAAALSDCSGVLQAEDAQLPAGLQAVDSSGSLPGFVAFPNDWDAENPAYIEWSLDACIGGTHVATLRYSAAEARHLQLDVNDQPQAEVLSCLPTGGSSSYAELTTEIDLSEGSNVVRLIPAASTTTTTGTGMRTTTTKTTTPCGVVVGAAGGGADPEWMPPIGPVVEGMLSQPSRSEYTMTNVPNYMLGGRYVATGIWPGYQNSKTVDQWTWTIQFATPVTLYIWMDPTASTGSAPDEASVSAAAFLDDAANGWARQPAPGFARRPVQAGVDEHLVWRRYFPPGSGSQIEIAGLNGLLVAGIVSQCGEHATDMTSVSTTETTTWTTTTSSTTVTPKPGGPNIDLLTLVRITTTITTTVTTTATATSTSTATATATTTATTVTITTSATTTSTTASTTTSTSASTTISTTSSSTSSLTSSSTSSTTLTATSTTTTGTSTTFTGSTSTETTTSTTSTATATVSTTTTVSVTTSTTSSTSTTTTRIWPAIVRGDIDLWVAGEDAPRLSPEARSAALLAGLASFAAVDPSQVTISVGAAPAAAQPGGGARRLQQALLRMFYVVRFPRLELMAQWAEAERVEGLLAAAAAPVDLEGRLGDALVAQLGSSGANVTVGLYSVTAAKLEDSASLSEVAPGSFLETGGGAHAASGGWIMVLIILLFAVMVCACCGMQCVHKGSAFFGSNADEENQQESFDDEAERATRWDSLKANEGSEADGSERRKVDLDEEEERQQEEGAEIVFPEEALFHEQEEDDTEGNSPMASPSARPKCPQGHPLKCLQVWDKGLPRCHECGREDWLQDSVVMCCDFCEKLWCTHCYHLMGHERPPRQASITLFHDLPEEANVEQDTPPNIKATTPGKVKDGLRNAAEDTDASPAPMVPMERYVGDMEPATGGLLNCAMCSADGGGPEGACRPCLPEDEVRVPIFPPTPAVARAPRDPSGGSAGSGRSRMPGLPVADFSGLPEADSLQKESLNLDLDLGAWTELNLERNTSGGFSL